MAQDSLNDAFFGSDKNYVKKLRELGFYRSQVDNYGILSRAGSPDIPLTHYCRALQAFGPGLFNDLGDQEKFFSRYAKMDEAKENYLSMIIETFKRENVERQLEVLKSTDMDESTRAILFSKLPYDRQEKVINELNLDNGDFLENKRLKLVFLKAAADELGERKTTGVEAIVSVVSAVTLVGVISGVLLGAISGVVFAGVGLSAAPVTIGACFVHFAVTKITRILTSEMEIRARNKSIEVDSAYLKRGEKLEQYFTKELEQKDFQSIKADIKDEKDKVYLMGIKSLEDLQRRNQSERSIIQTVKDRNDYTRGQNIAKGVEVVSMGLAIVMLLLLPTPVGIGIMSVVGAYAVGKLMESIAKNGLSLPYLGCLKPPALVARGMIFVARLCQFPVRYSIVKPYQYLVKFILLKKGEDNKVVDEKVAQQAKIEGNESANTLKDSVSALQFHRTGSPGNALFGGTVILADFIDSVYNLIQYFTDRSNKKVLNDLGVKVIHQGQQFTEWGILSSGGEDNSMTHMSRVLQREVRGLEEQKFRREAKRVVNSQKQEKPNSLRVATDKPKGYEKIMVETRSKGKCPMTGANDCRCPPGHDVAEHSAKTKTRAKTLAPSSVRSPQVRKPCTQVRKPSLPRRGQ